MGKIIAMYHGETKTEAKKEKTGISEGIVYFLQTYRKLLGAVLISGILALAGIIAGFGVRDSLRSKATGAAEAWYERYEALKADASASNETEARDLLQELQDFAPKAGAYSGARAYSIIASLHRDQKNWAEAENAWIAAAAKAPKTYLAPVALFNAAAAAEETGNLENALAHYQKALGYADRFPAAARTQFSIGRILEAQGNREAALEAYRKVQGFEEALEAYRQGQEFQGSWALAGSWTNLAHSRIIALTGGDS
ncbi:MAG: tetratricopeptide repeat protein [Treponema sp.]|jgi:tetratricopeptide (TPR) repeat protein|nr:tetratricopeptide repeat protein [Treponema sp.]